MQRRSLPGHSMAHSKAVVLMPGCLALKLLYAAAVLLIVNAPIGYAQSSSDGSTLSGNDTDTGDGGNVTDPGQNGGGGPARRCGRDCLIAMGAGIASVPVFLLFCCCFCWSMSKVVRALRDSWLRFRALEMRITFTSSLGCPVTYCCFRDCVRAGGVLLPLNTTSSGACRWFTVLVGVSFGQQQKPHTRCLWGPAGELQV